MVVATRWVYKKHASPHSQKLSVSKNSYPAIDVGSRPKTGIRDVRSQYRTPIFRDLACCISSRLLCCIAMTAGSRLFVCLALLGAGNVLAKVVHQSSIASDGVASDGVASRADNWNGVHG